MIVDENKGSFGRGMYGAPPRVVILDGKHRHAEAIARGDKTIPAYVGENAVKHLRINRDSGGPVAQIGHVPQLGHIYPNAHAHPIHKLHTGPLHSTVAGRTDHLPSNVPNGAYVLTADVVSGLGEGNTMAGFKAAKRMFEGAHRHFGGMPYAGDNGPYGQSGGPYGMADGGAITPLVLSHSQETPSDHGYAYHVTNEERLHDIAASGKLNTHKPGDFTDQDSWPDGSMAKRAYFGSKPLTHFAPESDQNASWPAHQARENRRFVF